MPKLEAKARPKLEWWKPLPKTALEVDIKSAIRSAINRLPYARLWLNQERKIENNGRTTWVPGLGPGSADLIGVVKNIETGHGIFLALEVKRPGQKPRADQEEFLQMVQNLGGEANVVTSVKDAAFFVSEARGVELAQVLISIEVASGKKLEF